VIRSCRPFTREEGAPDVGRGWGRSAPFDRVEAPLVMAIVIAIQLSERIDLDENVG
jgi:hypothetical protein